MTKKVTSTPTAGTHISATTFARRSCRKRARIKNIRHCRSLKPVSRRHPLGRQVRRNRKHGIRFEYKVTVTTHICGLHTADVAGGRWDFFWIRTFGTGERKVIAPDHAGDPALPCSTGSIRPAGNLWRRSRDRLDEPFGVTFSARSAVATRVCRAASAR